jgi:nucleotide-binding universal stress UspA family protein
MTPKDIVVFVEGEAGRDARLGFAAALAARWNAHLIATFVAEELALRRHAGYAIGGGLSSMMEVHRQSVERACAEARTAFDTIVARHPITHEWRLSRDEIGEALMLHARHAGLAIVGPSADDEQPTTVLSLSEDVIFASGRPTLLLPRDWPADRLPRRVVVGWNGSREAARAIADAMPFLTAAEAVQLVVVPEGKIRGLLGAEPGADIARHLARHGVAVTLAQLAGEDAGSLLLDHAGRHNADLLVMGASGQSRISEFIFGGATRRILAHARIPVLLSR